MTTSIRLPGLMLMCERSGSTDIARFMAIEDERGVGNPLAEPDVATWDGMAPVLGWLPMAQGWACQGANERPHRPWVVGLL